MVGQKLHKYQEQWRTSGYMNCCAAKGDQYEPTTVEQVANILTHGVSILPAISCVHDMLKRTGSSQLHHNVALLYGTSFVMLFTVSATFHLVALIPSLRYSTCRHIFHLGDRVMIYIFIASSYMPWLLLQGQPEFGFRVAYGVWTLALSGIIYSIFFHEKYKTLETVLYLCLGYLPALPLASMSHKGLWELFVGGLFYVVGIVFFKSDGRLPFAHSLWHLIGSIGTWTHHFAVLKYIYG